MKPTIAVAIALSLMASISVMAMTVAQKQTEVERSLVEQTSPPERGIPDNRQRAGTRSYCGESQASLTPMVPKTDGDFSGYTLDGYPMFWFYVPANAQTAKEGRFTLKDEQGKEVWKTNVKIPKERSRLVKVSLPADKQPLASNQSYRWNFVVSCYAGNYKQERSVSQSGKVSRLDDPSLQQQLKTAKLRDKIMLSQSRRIWYDANLNLAQLQSSPQEWSNFLASIGVDRKKEEIGASIFSKDSEKPEQR
jgi:hypothetical protein